MPAERRLILEMLSQGKITAEDAEKLLDKLAAASQDSEAGQPASVEGAPKRSTAPKFLRVVVDSSDGDKVNIRVPLALVRTGIKLTTMMPQAASEKLAEQGIDLSHLSGLKGEDLMAALQELTLDVDSNAGDKVKIFCE